LINYFIPVIFCEVPPQSINGERLYQRDEAAQQLVSYLLCGGGNKETPVCDDSFGAGKTSLIFKFRAVLDGLRPQTMTVFTTLCTYTFHLAPMASAGRPRKTASTLFSAR
jgi:hypothetical protein